MIKLRVGSRLAGGGPSSSPCRKARDDDPKVGRAFLQEGWVIANHILVSFHVAFISSVLALPSVEIFKGEVLKFIFVSPETIVSAIFMYISFHCGIALHEMGHWMTAAKLNALNDSSQDYAIKLLRSAPREKWMGLLRVFALAPYGKAPGIKREKLNYYPDAPYNLAVAASGPRMSRNVALIALPPAVLMLALGLTAELMVFIYLGRLLLGIGVVAMLDFFLADQGKYKEFRERERKALTKAKAVVKGSAWWEAVVTARRKMLTSRIDETTHPRLGPVTAPWQFRNCGMGGRHTEKEYPESNVSMQEAMFLILGARDYQEAQEMTVRLQNRLKEIIEKAEGCRVMGIGLEGGIAPYIERGTYPMPEVRLWAMMKQTIQECGYRPGEDVAIALDPAASELETAYRKHHNVPDAVGMYLFWRDKALAVLDRDGILDLYVKAIQEYDIPILSIEDGFSENDFEGWKKLLDTLGDRVFVIGDDLVTTNDATIELAAKKGLINTSLIKANQIGSLYETILAMLVALGKGQELVVSHRSKSPNDDMEAQIALAVNALGLKAGGGANTERLVKYSAVTEFMQRGASHEGRRGVRPEQNPVVRGIYAFEEPTNAGVPTVGATVELSLPDAGVTLKFHGATPLGTSAGTGEAIHLVDNVFERAEYREVIDRHADLFAEKEPGVFAFRKDVSESKIRDLGDEALSALHLRSQRYDGKGCLNAVENVRTVIAPAFNGRIVSTLTLKDVDRELLGLELHVARRRGKVSDSASEEEMIHVMQRKQNIGMNAMLSVSLAMARGLAHLKGQDLFELLREEIYAVVSRLTREHGVEIHGGNFDDYVTALVEVNARLEEEGKELHQVLRDLTGIYRVDGGPGRGIDVDESVPDAARDTLRSIAPRLGRDYETNAHHGLRHARDLIERAADLSRRLGVEEQVDWRVLATAACFHDIAASKQNHGADGAALAREVMGAADDMEASQLQRVEEAILLHDDRTSEGAKRREAVGIEAQLLYDVDQLDAFGVKGLYRYVAVWSQRGSRIEGIVEDARRRYQSLTFDATRELAGDGFHFTEAFFDRLGREHYTDGALQGATGVVHWIRSHAAEDPVDLADGALSKIAGETAGADLEFVANFFSSLRSAYSGDGVASMTIETPPPPEPAPSAEPLLSTEDRARVEQVSRQLFEVYHKDTDHVTRHDALYDYVTAKSQVNKRTGRFGLVNNRIFLAGDRAWVPYIVGDTLLVHRVSEGSVDTVYERPFSRGAILTDAMLARTCGVEGDSIDLEDELFSFDSSRAVPVRVGRIRDMAEQLKNINQSANRNEAVYVLRILVARLSLFSFKKYLSAKNLQSEVHNLLQELMRFINAPLSGRLPFLVRILVRDVAAVVTRPKLIDRLWNDTIDLAEIHVRGSEIVNEIRRSTHHAVGKHTLTLVRAYVRFLDTGEADALADAGYPVPSQADHDARGAEQPLVIARRIVEDLGQLLGSSETIARIHEWQEEYARTLTRCEYGKSLSDEAAAVVDGLREGNRWVFYHHLRLIRTRLSQFTDDLDGIAGFLARVDALLEMKPDDDGFDAAAAESELDAVISEFTDAVRAAYQAELFGQLEHFLGAYDRNEYHETFLTICRQRDALRAALDLRAFPEQRLLLLQLDCLLEEMGYLALRHIASEYEENGVDFAQCLEIIYDCVLNLTHNGLHSRQLRDLAAMLRDPNRTYAEIRNIVEQIHRNYHHVVQRVIAPFEKVRDKIGFDEEELRIALANMQRYMHDLNSIAYFTDIARAHIEQSAPDLTATVRGGAPVQRDPFDIIHISHTDEIRRRVNGEEPGGNLRDMFGGKGSGLLYISYLNIPTRDGFILPTALPQSGAHRDLDTARLDDELVKHVRILESDIARRDGAARAFGDADHPLLLAVRGGSVFSMPGMLSTVLFVGMNDEVAATIAREDPWCAYDSYRRFLASYGEAVWGVDVEGYNVVEDTKRRYGVKYKNDLPWEGMKEIAEATKAILVKEGHGDELEDILRDPVRQLTTTVRAVFNSWDEPAPTRYRDIKGTCHSWHTAAIVQEMALGNRKGEEVRAGMDETKASLTGVIPRTVLTDLGVRKYTGDFKFSAAGEDLVGGLTRSVSFRPIEEMGTYLPMLARRLRHIVGKLRRFMGTDQEIEFTVEHGVLSVLQSRAAEIARNARQAAFSEPGPEAAHGIGIRGSAFRGVVAFDDHDLAEVKREDLSKRDDVDGVLVILENPSPEQIPLVLQADALLSAKGGSTSHAAIAIHGIEGRDYCAVMSAGGLRVNARKHEASIVDGDGNVLHTIRPHDVISIHGTSGEVYTGSKELSHA